MIRLKWAAFVTHYNRPHMLERSLPQIMKAVHGATVLVVDDCSKPGHSEAARMISQSCGAEFLALPSNRGLAAVWNIAFGYLMADPSIKAIAEWQEDTDTMTNTLEVLDELLLAHSGACVTGHDAAEHRRGESDLLCNGIKVKKRFSCRATMMAATVESWKRVLPIPSRGLGLPKPVASDSGGGSNVDWHVCRDADEPLRVLCVPSLVRTFVWEAHDSCWANTQRTGEDDQLSTAAVSEWMDRRDAR